MKKNRILLSVAAAGAIAVGATALVAATAQASPAAPWQASLNAARESAASALETRVLDDASISESEYTDAYNAYATCLGKAGWQARPVPMGDVLGLEIEGKAEGESFDRANQSCRRGTVELIEPLYVGKTLNPNRVDAQTLLEDCFRKTGKVDADFTLEKLANGDVDVPEEAVTACVGRKPAK